MSSPDLNPEYPLSPAALPVVSKAAKRMPWFWLGLAGILSALGGGVLGYRLGHEQGMSAIGASAAQVAELQKTLKTQKSAIASISQAMTTVTQERDIALENDHNLQAKLAEENDLRQLADARLLTLATELSKRGGLDLQIRDIAIVPLPQRAFEYRIDLLGIRPNNHEMTGTLTLQLLSGANMVNIPLTDSQFKFTTAERLTGRWTMPANFKPEFLNVVVNSNGQTSEKRFAWEKGDTVPLTASTLDDLPPLPNAATK